MNERMNKRMNILQIIKQWNGRTIKANRKTERTSIIPCIFPLPMPFLRFFSFYNVSAVNVVFKMVHLFVCERASPFHQDSISSSFRKLPQVILGSKKMTVGKSNCANRFSLLKICGGGRGLNSNCIHRLLAACNWFILWCR